MRTELSNTVPATRFVNVDIEVNLALEGLELLVEPPSAELFVKLRAIARELSLPVPAVSPLLDLAVDGNAEAMARLLVLAPLARGAQHDEQLETLLAKGLADVADASAEELVAALRGAPAVQAQAAVELVAIGLTNAESDPARSALARLLKEGNGADAAQAHGWLAILERRPEPAAGAAQASGASSAQATTAAPQAGANPAPSGAAAPAAGSSQPAALPRPAAPITAATLAPVAAAAAAALSPAPTAVSASFGVSADPDWPVTVIPNPAWTPSSAATGSTNPAPAVPAGTGRTPPASAPQPACAAEPSKCSTPRDARPGG